MKTFAVGFVSMFNNELTIEFHKANTADEAAKMHTLFATYDFEGETTLEKLKEVAFNCDAALDCVEVPSN